MNGRSDDAASTATIGNAAADNGDDRPAGDHTGEWTDLPTGAGQAAQSAGASADHLPEPPAGPLQADTTDEAKPPLPAPANDTERTVPPAEPDQSVPEPVTVESIPATSGAPNARSDDDDAPSDASDGGSQQPSTDPVTNLVVPDVAQPAAEAPPSTARSELLMMLIRIGGRLDELARLGERHADHVSSLHSENQRLRAGELQTAINPMIRDVIRLYDDVVRLTVGSTSSPDLDIVSKLLLDTLDRWGVKHFEPATGDAFDTAAHAGVVRVATNEPISNTIAAVRRCGFKYAGKILRTADVEVYRQMEPVPDAPFNGAPDQIKEEGS